jgi:hypothetical protein
MQINELLGRNTNDESYQIHQMEDTRYRFETVYSNRVYDVMFSTFDAEVVDVTFGLIADKEYNYYNYGLAPTNNIKETIKIFTTIVKICKQFNVKHDPLVWVFSAKEPSRIKLYKRLAETLAKSFNLKMSIEQMYGDNMFVLSKKTEEANHVLQRFIRDNAGWEFDS